jgi:hypothetical protein
MLSVRLEPIRRSPYASDAGDTPNVDITPLPTTRTVSGDPAALWRKTISAFLSPTEFGVNETVNLCDLAESMRALCGVTANSVDELAAEVIES